MREALSEGHRLGLVGGSDTHEGQPGHDALTAVWAPRLSRDQVFEALHARRCYATSANRTIIELSNVTDGTAGFRILVAADGEIDRVEIVADGAVAHSVAPEHPRVAEFNWRPRANTRIRYCFVRVLLKDGNAAWSSPLWAP